MPPGELRVVELAGRVSRHADLPHHGLRAQVRNRRDRHHLVGVDVGEGPVLRRPRALGREALAVDIRGEAPTRSIAPRAGLPSPMINMPMAPTNRPSAFCSAAQNPNPCSAISVVTRSINASLVGRSIGPPSQSPTRGSALIAAKASRSASRKGRRIRRFVSIMWAGPASGRHRDRADGRGRSPRRRGGWPGSRGRTPPTRRPPRHARARPPGRRDGRR